MACLNIEKLRLMGVSGRTLSLVDRLYDSSLVRLVIGETATLLIASSGCVRPCTSAHLQL